MWHSSRPVIACILVYVFGLSSGLPAQTHVVSPADLQKAIVTATQSRQHNTESVMGLLSLPAAERAMQHAGIAPAQVKNAVSSLNDEELARLAARSEKAQTDFAAGRLSDRDLIIILLGIVALILIIVAVR
jgi:hypothetical protein